MLAGTVVVEADGPRVALLRRLCRRQPPRGGARLPVGRSAGGVLVVTPVPDVDAAIAP
ncbi:hypothetical protein ACWEH1_14500 [Micromonospora chersina]